MKFKSVISGIVAAALLSSATFAAGTAPLAAGKPAGTKQADLMGPTTSLVILAGVAGLIIFIAAGGFDNTPKATTGTSS